MIDSSVDKCKNFEEVSKDTYKLNMVGMYFKPSGNKVHPFCALIEQATELAMWPLVDKLKET